MFLAESAGKAAEGFKLFGMSNQFWIIMIVLALFIVSILTSSYNDDKTKGL
ncbi:MAG: hypothetical protein P0Y55_04020 [Candidatus Cohnella colombiensis]|uniref:Uncharacterized protein n=1 Tax=Candidatus Cohnella colombiensis TaxID=3121368 RepID=A0AA95F0T0_9BACL|nr:MAG: hypothetical protein P0Y55_04020 [Cohnella sp.]